MLEQDGAGEGRAKNANGGGKTEAPQLTISIGANLAVCGESSRQLNRLLGPRGPRLSSRPTLLLPQPESRRQESLAASQSDGTSATERSGVKNKTEHAQKNKSDEGGR